MLFCIENTQNVMKIAALCSVGGVAGWQNHTKKMGRAPRIKEKMSTFAAKFKNLNLKKKWLGI